MAASLKYRNARDMGGLGMHKFVWVAVSACLLAGTTFADGVDTAPAANTKNKVASTDSFAALDRNGDRRISRSEAGFDRVLSQTFAEIDTDGDGFVSEAEFAAAEKTRTTANLTTR